MKKLFFLGALFAVGLGFTACSSDKDEATLQSGNSSGESYISLAIQLPTAPSTRADATQNDQFDDGLVTEYAVKDATLILFEGTAESSATYSGNYDMNLSWNNEDPANDQITTTAQIVQKVNNRTSSTNNFYAYVVLNKPSTLSTILASASGKTFSELFGASTSLLPATSNLTETVDGTTNCIPMTNAPLANYPGGASSPTDGTMTVLAQIDADKIYATEALAAANPATNVYVERAYAKATVACTETALKKNDGTAVTPAVNFSFAGWTLDNTNKEEFFQRNVVAYSTWYNLHSTVGSPTDSYRFAGSNAVTTGKYRIYWATDPNYNDGVAAMSSSDRSSYATANFNRANESNAIQTVSTPLYCYENTFSVADQIHVCTTRAIISLQFNGSASGDKGFYTINDDYTHLYTGTDAAAQQNALKQAVIDYLKGNPTVWTAMQAVNVAFTTPTITNSTMTIGTDANKITISGVTLGDGTYSLPLNTTALEKVVSNMFNPSGDAKPTHHIKYYAGGKAYYPVLIKHFGDSDTPWISTDHLSTGAYADDDSDGSKYLGRYGMVRNNWYNLSVSKVTNLGYPTIPEPGTPTDDEVHSYISVQINVLSWAKRTQDVTL